MTKIGYVNCIESGHELLEHLLKNDIKVDYIITLNPEQAIKYKVSGYKDFSKIAQKYNIPIYYPKKFNLKSEQDKLFFEQSKFDILMVFGWQRLISDNIIKSVKRGCLGAHGSSERLPKGRGRSPINWSLVEGKDRFILHLFYIDAGIDSGDIIDFYEFDINSWDTCQTVYKKVQVCLRKMLLKNMPLIENGTATRTKQNEHNATYYPKRTPEDGKINWSSSTVEIYNLVRAVTHPYPGAFSPVRKIMIWKAVPFDTKIEYKQYSVGEVVEIFEDKTFLVKTADGTLLVTKYDCKTVINVGEKI